MGQSSRSIGSPKPCTSPWPAQRQWDLAPAKALELAGDGGLHGPAIHGTPWSTLTASFFSVACNRVGLLFRVPKHHCIQDDWSRWPRNCDIMSHATSSTLAPGHLRQSEGCCMTYHLYLCCKAISLIDEDPWWNPRFVMVQSSRVVAFIPIFAVGIFETYSVPTGWAKSTRQDDPSSLDLSAEQYEPKIWWYSEIDVMAMPLCHAFMSLGNLICSSNWLSIVRSKAENGSIGAYWSVFG